MVAGGGCSGAGGLTGTVAAQAPAAAAPVKVCFVYMSPIGDAGWTYPARPGPQGDGRRRSAARCTTKYVENVAEGADAERVIRELAQSG